MAEFSLPVNPARPFGAILTAMVTPMNVDGSVDVETAVQLASHLVDNGHDGLVLNGTTGESPTTHTPEKSDLIRAVVDAVGDRAKIVAGACSPDTAHAIRMAEAAAAAGADGLLVSSPYYSRPSQEGVYRHILAIAESTDLPCMVYDVPGRTGVRIAPETILRLAEHGQIVAVKDASGDIYNATKLIQRTDLAWYCGDDSLFLSFLASGAAGTVSVAGHVIGRELAEITAACDTGNFPRAAEIFVRISPAIDAINGAGFQAVMAKVGLELLGLLPNRALRLPQVAATDDEVAAVRAGLVAAGLLDTN